MDFDYRQYSLSKLDEWVNDAVSCSEATPQEIYDTIKRVVEENYHSYKNQTERCYELLALLNGNGKGHIEAYDKFVCDKDDKSPECRGAWNSFWEDDVIKEDKVINWVLPVQADDTTDEYFVSFPDDLLNAANLKEGDWVNWIDNNDGTYTLEKVENPTDKNTKD